ncbi:hypothetical protein [Alteromonas sp. RKMC-009]|uniref:hypothetical protein n=1 Tax=Alteromonas sp. RKMC-009 TaxID=2267264 RepID=UPI000E67F200|nr:hypothetical protein [Alteromonas sp. RKMC-009]AYA64317.1 hypothetical protein DS731_10080 [Alteromonas sp. RKMC-009]
MATFFTASAIKQNGYQHLKDNVTTAYLCKAPAKSDSLATIQGKAIAQAAVAGSDVAFSASGNDLLVTINGKSGLDPSGTAASGDDIAVVYCSASAPLVCVDATDRTITNNDGDTLDIPAAQIYVRELGSV